MNPGETTLSEACTKYLETRTSRDKQYLQQELFRFIRWCGWDKAVGSLAPIEIEGYCSTLEGMGEDKVDRLNVTKKFLSFLQRHNFTSVNLASHARVRRSTRRPSKRRSRREQPANWLTQEGHSRLKQELESLKAQRVTIAGEIRQAAATKDVTENSPLEAAREQQGQLEARIRDIEALLRDATVMDGSYEEDENGAVRVEVGRKIVLKNAETGKEVTYLVVHSREADPTAGKISSESPVGKAVLDRKVGEPVEVVTPRGVVTYEVSSIE